MSARRRGQLRKRRREPWRYGRQRGHQRVRRRLGDRYPGSSGSGGDGTDVGGASGGEGGSGGASDTTAPVLVSSSPTEGAVDVERDEALTLTFSEPLAPDTVVPANIELLLDGQPVEAAVSADSDSIRVTPSAPMTLLGAYEVVVSRGVTDLAGNSLAAEIRVAFSVRDGVLSEPRRLNTELLGPVENFDLKPDNRGNVVAVWDQRDTVRRNIWWSRWNGATRAWETPATLESDTLETGLPCVAFNALGQGVAMWWRGLDQLAARRYDGSSWLVQQTFTQSGAGVPSANGVGAAVQFCHSSIGPTGAAVLVYNAAPTGAIARVFDGIAGWVPTAVAIAGGNFNTPHGSAALPGGGLVAMASGRLEERRRCHLHR